MWKYVLFPSQVPYSKWHDSLLGRCFRIPYPRDMTAKPSAVSRHPLPGIARPMGSHTVAVFAPMLTLTVTVESVGSDEGDEIHVHAGGQGVWVARMLRELGEQPIICGPLGGEVGHVIHGLVKEWEIDLSTVETHGSSPATVQDRRSGERQLIAEGEPLTLERHELDDLYGKFLDLALASKVVVITGQLGEVIPTDTYRRLGHDLDAVGVTVVADIHGPDLSAFLEGGPIGILKVSDENLAEDGLLEGDDEEAARSAMDRLVADGAEAVVLSRARPSGPRPAGRRCLPGHHPRSGTRRNQRGRRLDDGGVGRRGQPRLGPGRHPQARLCRRDRQRHPARPGKRLGGPHRDPGGTRRDRDRIGGHEHDRSATA